MKAIIDASRTPSGTVTAPPSKSMAHRLLLCAALSAGTTVIENLDYSADISATLAAAQQLGAAVAQTARAATITGVAPPFASPATPVDCNESGSTLRFLIPIFSLCAGPVTFTGAQRLFQRPLTAYADIFARQGLLFAKNGASLTVGGPLQSGAFHLPGDVSSQFISGLLFALPLLGGDSTLHIAPPLESRAYVELTREAQGRFGVTSTWQTPHTLLVPGGQRYRAPAAPLAVEGDWSQGAVPAVIAAAAGSAVLQGLPRQSAQGDRVILSILEKCCAEITNIGENIRVSHPVSGLLAPGDIDLADCPDLGPILCALALFCKGETRLVNAGRLRIKESDRIASMQAELASLGADITSTADTVRVLGGKALCPTRVLQSHNDHRVVMALSAVALGFGLRLEIDGAEAIRKSWPAFFDTVRALGAEVMTHD